MLKRKQEKSVCKTCPFSITLKMKEAVTTREVNQYLVEERTKLQNEKSHLERELEQERRINDERKKEIADVISKVITEVAIFNIF